MNSNTGKNKSVPVNIVLTLINIILIVILILIILSDQGEKTNITNNIKSNNIINEVNETNNITNKVNNASNSITIDPNETNIEVNEVAKIGDKVYNSLQEAINDVEDEKATPSRTPAITRNPNGTAIEPSTDTNAPTVITLLKDITSSFIVSEKKNILIDMDNHTITGAGDNTIATINGKVTIENGTIIGKYTKRQINAVKVADTGKLVCSNLNFDLTTSEEGWIINSEGTLSLKSTKLNYLQGTAVNNSGTIEEISGDTLIESNNNYIALYNLGTINKINGGEIKANDYAIYNSGTIDEISGDVKVTSNISYAIYSSGTIGTITDNVSISSNSENKATVYNNSGTIEKINGSVSINSEHNRALYNMGMIKEISGNVNINSNGDASVSTIYNSNPGEMTIMGGTITQKNNGYGVYREGGTVTIVGGTISSKYNC